jgi:hypothetical protein
MCRSLRILQLDELQEFYTNSNIYLVMRFLPIYIYNFSYFKFILGVNQFIALVSALCNFKIYPTCIL